MGILVSTLWSKLWGDKEYKIVMVGLHNAGKTTILYKLHLGDVIETQPTIGSNVEEVCHRNIRFQVRSALRARRRRNLGLDACSALRRSSCAGLCVPRRRCGTWEGRRS